VGAQLTPDTWPSTSRILSIMLSSPHRETEQPFGRVARGRPDIRYGRAGYLSPTKRPARSEQLSYVRETAGGSPVWTLRGRRRGSPGRVMRPAPLPRRTGQRRTDRAREAAMGVGDDQPPPRQPAGG